MPHAEGYQVSASAEASHAEGFRTKTNSGSYTHAEGIMTEAKEYGSHAEERRHTYIRCCFTC